MIRFQEQTTFRGGAPFFIGVEKLEAAIAESNQTLKDL